MRFSVLAPLLLLLAPALATAGEFEQPKTLSAGDLLPADVRSGEGYTVADRVEADGFFEQYTLQTEAFGEFHPTSSHELYTRIVEVRALIALDRIGSAEAFAKQSLKAGSAPVVLVYKLATAPVDTLTGVPRGIYRGGKKAVKWLGGDRRERAETENSATREVIGFSRRKREFAAELGIDPYTSNETLRAELDRVAWASFAGGISVSAALAAVAIPPVADFVMKVSRMAISTNELASSMSGGDLHRRNRAALNAMGLDAERVEAFLNNESMSPTQKTAVSLALESMPGVAGLEEIVGLGVDVQTQEAAIWIVTAARMAAGYHQHVAPVARVAPIGDELAVVTAGGTLVAVLPADRLLWTEHARDLSAALSKASPGGASPSAREVWILGEVSDRAHNELALRGLSVQHQTLERLAIERSAPATETPEPN